MSKKVGRSSASPVILCKLRVTNTVIWMKNYRQKSF